MQSMPAIQDRSQPGFPVNATLAANRSKKENQSSIGQTANMPVIWLVMKLITEIH